MKNSILPAAALLVALAPIEGQSQPTDQCTTVADCAQKAMEASYQAKLALSTAVPRGAVMAFNLVDCPDGWTDFDELNGRTIVGSGPSENLTDRQLGESGGAETHTLNTSEMPKHNHPNKHTNKLHTPQHIDHIGDEYGLITDSTTGFAGDSQPHNNMQPFHVLKYCTRK